MIQNKVKPEWIQELNNKLGESLMKRILIVEDQAMARTALRLFLEQQGYECVEADNGATALAWLDERQPVHLIITDNKMPVMDGLQFLKALRERNHLTSIPVILYSGYLTEDLERWAHEAGASAVLAKPYTFQELLATVTLALEQGADS